MGAGIETAEMAGGPDATRPVLTVDLMAVVANYRLIAARVAPAEASAVVKADAYGLGAGPVAMALAAAGCRTFFVAHAQEAPAVRAAAPDAAIFVLHGYDPAHRALFAQYKLSPVLSSSGQVSAWLKTGLRQPHALHLDTGMARLGLSPSEAAAVEGASAPALVMSHLACSDDPAHGMNEEQLARFREAIGRFPGARYSLAASGGCFLGAPYNFDLVRPGIALYGGNPQKTLPSPVQGVATLSAPLLQVRSIDSGDTVGYGATYSASGPRRLGIAALGYADGLMRSLSNRGVGVIAGVKCPVVGRVSMDLVTLDVSRAPAREVHPGARVVFIGEGQSVDELAQAAGTMAYEIFTRLGPRVERRYTGAH